MSIPQDDEYRFRRVVHENDLMNHRITWFITLQGLLFTALGFAWDKTDAGNFILTLSFLGMFTSISSASVLWGGARAIDNLLESATTEIGRQANWVETIMYPWYTFPVLFAGAWIIILVLK